MSDLGIVLSLLFVILACAGGLWLAVSITREQELLRRGREELARLRRLKKMLEREGKWKRDD